MQFFKKEKYIVDEKGKKTATILPIKKYEELMEDLHDLAVVAERRDETTITFNKLKERLRKNGLLWYSMEKISRERFTGYRL